jgi:hypothetical protein
VFVLHFIIPHPHLASPRPLLMSLVMFLIPSFSYFLFPNSSGASKSWKHPVSSVTTQRTSSDNVP